MIFRSHIRITAIAAALSISISAASSAFAQSPATAPAAVDLSVPDKQVDAGLEFLRASRRRKASSTPAVRRPR